MSRARAHLRSSLAALLLAGGAALAPAPLRAAEPSRAAQAGADSDVASGHQAQIADLERQIAADRAALRELIGQSGVKRSDIASDPRLREIAERLPRLQRELDMLRREPAP